MTALDQYKMSVEELSNACQIGAGLDIISQRHEQCAHYSRLAWLESQQREDGVIDKAVAQANHLKPLMDQMLRQ